MVSRASCASQQLPQLRCFMLGARKLAVLCCRSASEYAQTNLSFKRTLLVVWTSRCWIDNFPIMARLAQPLDVGIRQLSGFTAHLTG